MEQGTWDTIVIGGGASGLAAAVAAGRMGERVLLIEKQDRLGKKLAATGNGRCNLMHLGDARYYGDAGFARQVLALCGAAEQRRFWRELGLLLRTEGGTLVYPATFQASSVIDALKTGLKLYGVTMLLRCPVVDLRMDADSVTVLTEEGSHAGKRCILATGGSAGPKLGGSGFSDALLRAHGFDSAAVFPALTPLDTDKRSISGLSGLRVSAGLRLLDDQNRCLHAEQGEVLFTDYGVSGICAMQCARFVHGRSCRLSLNLISPLSLGPEELRAELRERSERFRDLPPEMLLSGILPVKMSYAVCKQAGIPMKGETIGQLSASQIHDVGRTAMDYRLTVVGARGFDQAQVTAGGALCSQFVPETLASRRFPALHVTGEALNVDGDCGGYNLMFAFASGILAGLNGRKNPWEENRQPCEKGI